MTQGDMTARGAVVQQQFERSEASEQMEPSFRFVHNTSILYIVSLHVFDNRHGIALAPRLKRKMVRITRCERLR